MRNHADQETFYSILKDTPWIANLIFGSLLFSICMWIIPFILVNWQSPDKATYFIFILLSWISQLFAVISAIFFSYMAIVSYKYDKVKFDPDYVVPSHKINYRNCSEKPRKATVISDSERYQNFLNNVQGIDSLKQDENHIESQHFAFEPTAEAQNAPIPLNHKILKSIEWFSFELLCKKIYEFQGFRVTKTESGADGGIDLVLYERGSIHPHAIIQCKARSNRDIPVNYVRELLGVVTAEQVKQGILITNSGFTRDALEFASKTGIQTVDLFQLHKMILTLPHENQIELQYFLGSIDFTTPTCPNCEIKLVPRTSKQLKNSGEKFWGCSNFPRCTYSLKTASLSTIPEI